MINFHQLHANLVVGTCPVDTCDIALLLDHGISAVVNLQSNADLTEHGIDWSSLTGSYAEAGLVAQRQPMIDFDESNIEANLPAAIEAVQQLIANDHNIYLHCNAGRERSPTVATGWLALYGDMTLQQALQHVRDVRKGLPYESMLRRVIQQEV